MAYISRHLPSYFHQFALYFIFWAFNNYNEAFLYIYIIPLICFTFKCLSPKNKIFLTYLKQWEREREKRKGKRET